MIPVRHRTGDIQHFADTEKRSHPVATGMMSETSTDLSAELVYYFS